ncbi:MAG TPA: DUF169 domain-containing protein [Dehalococcoidia bacterium]|nr:DUF169 domain-containing protein [Dehalococcoidia bacterium]
MPQTSLTELLRLTSPPVAITFVDAAPPGVPHVSAVEPAGCGYWRRAAEGEVFFTIADDHKRCPVGAHTHNVTLSPSEQQELMGLVQTMVGLSYLKMEEVPQIPTRKTPLQVAVYGPLAAAPVTPDVVLIRGNAQQLMLLAEAAQAAGVAGTGATMGRPTCAVLPEAITRPAPPQVSAASATASTPAPTTRKPTSPFQARNSAPSRKIWR